MRVSVSFTETVLGDVPAVIVTTVSVETDLVVMANVADD